MGTYSSVKDHRSMVFDEVRNAVYARAIEAAVTPDTVVLELGAGLGLHGLIAARAGARKVYLVEPAPIIEVTRRVVQASGLKNVELIAARAEKLELPEQVDLLISVFTGNFLLGEDLLPLLFAVREKHLRPGGRMIPDRAEMRVAPVSATEYYAETVGCWSSPRSAPDASIDVFDYSAARRYAANTAYHGAASDLKPEMLAPANTLMELDFLTANRAECNHHCEFSAAQDGLCHGWLGWFRMRLGEEWLSTSPNAEPMHWSQVLLPLDPPLDLAAGDKINLHLRRPEHGDWNWATSCAGQQQRASTFLSVAPQLEKLHKMADSYRPITNRRGEAVSHVLSRFKGKVSSAAIAAEVFSSWSDQFNNENDAVLFVRELVEKYG